jgi:hypothetical protein
VAAEGVGPPVVRFRCRLTTQVLQHSQLTKRDRGPNHFPKFDIMFPAKVMDG